MCEESQLCLISKMIALCWTQDFYKCRQHCFAANIFASMLYIHVVPSFKKFYKAFMFGAVGKIEHVPGNFSSMAILAASRVDPIASFDKSLQRF